MQGRIRVGIGGWTFEPWRGVFYPEGLVQRRELEFASRALTAIEINGTFYSRFAPASWRKWRDETPDDFVFAVKGSRYCTNRRVLAEAGPSIERFMAQGLTELGPKLGPINWQLAATKRFDATDIDAFLALLPREQDGLALRHAIEVRHPSFATEAFTEIAARHAVAVVWANGEGFPQIDAPTADFTYARWMATREDVADGITTADRRAITKRARAWAKRGDTFVFFISGAKARNPAAAVSLIAALGRRRG